MAKIKFGMMMTDASGKLGGQVFAKNRGGSYVRTKGIPTNPQSTFQTAVRNLFASISSGWSSLSSAARLSWNSSVGAYAKTDVFGDLRNPSGKALFQRLNQNLAISGQAQLSVCPQPLIVPGLIVNSVTLTVTSKEIAVETIGNVEGSTVVFWGTPPVSNGTSFVKNDLRQLWYADGEEDGVYSDYTAYTNRFGAFVLGQNIFIGVRVVNTNGQASPLQVVKATVVA